MPLILFFKKIFILFLAYREIHRNLKQHKKYISLIVEIFRLEHINNEEIEEVEFCGNLSLLRLKKTNQHNSVKLIKLLKNNGLDAQLIGNNLDKTIIALPLSDISQKAKEIVKNYN